MSDINHTVARITDTFILDEVTLRSGRQDNGKPKQHSVVIPAKAGIQWFLLSIAA